MISNIDKQDLVFSRSQSNLAAQTEARAGHDQKACNVVSLLSLQPGQRSSEAIFLFFRLALEGSVSEPALQSIVLTRLGTRKP